MQPTRLLLAALTIALLAQQAEAVGRQAPLTGSALGIDTPCARRVDIQPDPALHAQATVSATADHQEELDGLVLDTKGAAQIHTIKPGCWRPEPLSSFSPTMDLVVRIPPGFAITIDESGTGRYTIGPVRGALSVNLSGLARIAADQVTTLAVDLSGEAGVDVKKVQGNGQISISGHGNVSIADATMATLSVEVSGAGNVTIDGGRIGKVSLSNSGFSKMRIGAEVGGGDVAISGAGTVHFAKLTGVLHKDVSGVGTVSVGSE